MRRRALLTVGENAGPYFSYSPKESRLTKPKNRQSPAMVGAFPLVSTLAKYSSVLAAKASGSSYSRGRPRFLSSDATLVIPSYVFA